MIENNPNRREFLNQLSDCTNLVFLPIARETFCRLVVEAKCMGVEVITTRNYGASLEPWFDMKGDDMIKFLRIKTNKNLKIIEKFINAENETTN